MVSHVVQPVDGRSSSSDIETPPTQDSVTSRPGEDLKPDGPLESKFVDSRTGEVVDVEKEFPGVSPDELPEYVRKQHVRVDFRKLQRRIGTTTHAGVKAKHLRAVTVLGRIGWVAKGVVYGLIGGLCCRAAVAEGRINVDASPQGAFILIGKGVAGIYILIIMAVALATYIIWRFWEGITAQGSHPCYSKFKNFFTFRLSPIVSGFVYTAYLVYILTLLPKAIDYHDDAVGKTEGNDFTASWRKTAIGRTGLVVVGLAFLIATIVMLQGVLTKKFHRELRLKELRLWAKWLLLISGHLGQLGRAGLFLLVSVLMWRALRGDEGGNAKQNTVSRALLQLTETRWGRAILFLIGFGLVIYALFACLNAYPGKIFPTPLPSQEEMDKMIRKREEKERKKAEAKERARALKESRLPKPSESQAQLTDTANGDSSISAPKVGDSPAIAPVALATAV